MERTLTIGFPYVADRFGGSTASSLVLAGALRDAGHRIHILTHGQFGRVADEACAMGLSVTRLPPLADVPGYSRPDRFRLEQLLAFRTSRAAIRMLHLDIVHTNDITTLRSWMAPSLATSTALVAHWRSNFQESWSVRTALHIARAVIAVSQYSFAKLPAWVREKTTVEYNSFDLEYSPALKQAARQEIRAQFGLPPDAVLIGVFANHLRRKRTHVLADLLARIGHTANGRPVFGLACGGRAEPYDDLLDKKITEFGLEQRLIRPGFVRPVERWMGACDAVLAPAINEPLARNVLEAQALGVPVVASTDGGLKELIRHGENGLLCDPYDLAAWEIATRRLLDEGPFAQALAEQGRQDVVALSPARHAERVAAIYRGLFDHAPRHRTEAA